jgi:hypothetical protein
MCYNPGPEGRVPSPNRYTADAKFCFWKNNKRMMIDRGGERKRERERETEREREE